MTTASAQAPAPTVFVSVDDALDPVLPGTQVSYALEIKNFSDEPLESLSVETATPEGTTFAGIFFSEGEWTTPANGEAGPISGVVYDVAAGATVRASFGFALAQGTPSRVDLVATVRASSGFELELDEPTFVAEAGSPMLRWGLTERTAGTPDGTPRYLRVERSGAPGPPFGQILPTLVVPGVEYRVYRSPDPGVVPGEDELFLTVPFNQVGTGSIAAEPGYFYAVTMEREGVETAPSNEVSFGAGEPTVETTRIVGSKLVATGSGFEEGVVVTAGPAGFVKPAKVKAGGTKLQQPGRLTNGMTIKQVAGNGRVTLLTFRNPNGGTTSVLHGLLNFLPPR